MHLFDSTTAVMEVAWGSTTHKTKGGQPAQHPNKDNDKRNFGRAADDDRANQIIHPTDD